MDKALRDECARYNLDYERVVAEYSGRETGDHDRRAWWDYLIIAAAVGVFVWLGKNAAIPPIAMNFYWIGALAVVLFFALAACCFALWKTTRFS
jgi:hypothetical protein